MKKAKIYPPHKISVCIKKTGAQKTKNLPRRSLSGFEALSTEEV